MTAPILAAAKKYLESVPYRFTEGESVLSVLLAGANGNFTINVTSNEEFGWLICYALGPIQVPTNARATVGEYMHRLNYVLSIGNFELNYEDGAFVYKTNTLAGKGAIPTHGAIASAIGLAFDTMDRWYAGITAILYSGLSPQAALERAEKLHSSHVPT